eukprot:PhF_6_TR23258/c0_g1_i3/m.32683
MSLFCVLVSRRMPPKLLTALSNMAFAADALPYRAPETFDDPTTFNTYSDAFSFGVMMYEIMSTTPFLHSRSPPSVVIPWVVSNGHKGLSMDGIHPEIQSLIQATWHLKPNYRVGLPEIVRRLKILADELHVVSSRQRLSEIREALHKTTFHTAFSSNVPRALVNCLRHHPIVPLPATLLAACHPLKDFVTWPTGNVSLMTLITASFIATTIGVRQ